MKAGKLRNRVTIEQPVAGAINEYGEPAKTYAAFATVWASVSAVGPKEYEYAKTFASTASVKVTTRYIRGVKPTMRINFGGRILQIAGAVNTDEVGAELTIYCTEVS